MARRPKSEFRELVETVLGAAALAIFIMVFIARAFTVEGPSMLPTFHDGERVLVDKITYRFRAPQRGDVVVFRYPANPKEHFIKRVIGVAGDTVQVRNGAVYLNGEEVKESYINGQMYGRFGPVSIPVGHYFVLGDNRNNSKDSRDPQVGLITKQSIVGRALWRYWPVQKMGVVKRPPVLEAKAGG